MSSILIYRNSKEKVFKIPISEFEKRVGIRYTGTLLFEREIYREKLIKKAERHLKSAELNKTNKWTLALHEKAMENPRENLYYIRWIDSYLGYGVFAAQNIPALCYLGEYTGLVRKRSPFKLRFNDYVFGCVAAGKRTRYIIDAEKQGNFTRFVNHSIDPNLNSRWVVKDGLTRIILFSNKLIRKDTQLSYYYGEQYWKSRTYPEEI